jgi:predicted ATPase
VRTEPEEIEHGIAQMELGLTGHRATGGRLREPYWLALLVEGYAEAGNIEQAMTVLAEALKVVDKTEERWYEAELYRLKGELLLRQNSRNADEATDLFRNALETARAQGAKALELRATVSLARLLTSQGRRDGAHTMLAEIYNWFTEGFDAADLKEAKTLLEELNGSRPLPN